MYGNTYLNILCKVTFKNYFVYEYLSNIIKSYQYNIIFEIHLKFIYSALCRNYFQIRMNIIFVMNRKSV